MLTTVEKIQIIDKYSLSNRFFNMFYLESNSVMGATAKKKKGTSCRDDTQEKGKRFNQDIPPFSQS